MPGIFETGIQQTASIGSVSGLCWQPSNTSATTFGPLGSVPSGSVLTNVTVLNTGSSVIYVGMGSASAAATTGAQVQPGGQVTFTGYNVTAGTATTGNIWANTTTGNTSTTLAGMTTLPQAV